jgi:hypothetical protein
MRRDWEGVARACTVRAALVILPKSICFVFFASVFVTIVRLRFIRHMHLFVLHASCKRPFLFR